LFKLTFSVNVLLCYAYEHFISCLVLSLHILKFAPVYCCCTRHRTTQTTQKCKAGSVLHWIHEERKQRGWTWLTWRDTDWRDIECMDMKWKYVCLMAMAIGQRRL